MDTVARVSPRSLASAATSGSDMKHTALPPNFSSTRLFTPEKAIWVSVTMVQPAFMAAIPFSTAPGENTRLSAYSKSAREHPVAQLLGDELHAPGLDVRRGHPL